MNIKILIIQFFLLPSLILNYIKIKLKKVKYKKYPHIKGKLIIRGQGKIIIGENVIINSSFNINPVGLNDRSAFFTIKDSTIKIGNRVGISNTLIYAMDIIEIEDNVLIGGGCQILDNDFHPIDYETRIIDDNSQIRKKPILIKEGAFIGASTIILKGVTIGKHSVIGAGSVVSKNIPDNEIWAGNPAVFVRKLK